MCVCARECEVGGSNYGNSKPTLEIEIEIDGSKKEVECKNSEEQNKMDNDFSLHCCHITHYSPDLLLLL